MALRASAHRTASGAEVAVSLQVVAERRAPSDLCLVIDVSGSMQLPAILKDREANAELSILDIVVHSCRSVVHTLSAEDTLGIVTYSDQAAVVLEPTAMSEPGKARAEEALQKLRADGQTNLWQGLETALDLLRRSPRPGALGSALLLTDGKPNVEPTGGHLAALQRYKEKHGLPCTLHTFGFGSDLDSELLDQLAAAAGGVYVFIPDAGFVGTALVNCTAAAVTAAGRNLRLSVAAAPNVALKGCVGYELGTCLELGSVQLGQSKDVVIDLECDLPVGSKLLDLSATFTGPLGLQTLQAEALLQEAAPSAESVFQRWRLRLAELLRELLRRGEARLKEAQDLVQEFLKELRLARQEVPLLEGLLEDVQGQVAEAVSRQDWYMSWGAHYLRSLSRAHLSQVCNNFKDPGVQGYGGELFQDVRDVADEIFLKLPPPNPAVRSGMEMLMAMGFPEVEVTRALDFAHNNVETAATYLMEGFPARRPPAPGAVRPGRSAPAVDMSHYYDASGG